MPRVLPMDFEPDSSPGPPSRGSGRLLLKIDLIIMPLLVIASNLAFLDKNAMAFAALFGMNKDAHLEEQQYSWLGSIFYLGYLFMEFPVIWLLSRVSMRKYVALLTVLWGALVCSMATCHSFAGLAVARFFLGVLEAGLLPCFLIIMSMWYLRQEQPLRTALWSSPFAGILGGIFAFAIDGSNSQIATWKLMFIIYGCATVFVGIVIFFALPENPLQAWFLSRKEREAAHSRILESQAGLSSSKEWNSAHVWEAVLDPKYWVLNLFAVAQSITNAGITNFNPLIISGYGFSDRNAALVASGQSVFVLVTQVSFALIASHVPNIRCLLWIISCVPPITGTLMIHFSDIEHHRFISLAGVYLLGFYNVSWVMMLSLQSSNNGGFTKKSFAAVSIAIAYAPGNIIGPQFFRSSQAPYYQLGIVAMLCSFCVMAVAGVLYWHLCFNQNQDKDRRYGDPSQASYTRLTEDGTTKFTDKENPNFRYVY